MHCRNPAIDEAAVERTVSDRYDGRGSLTFVPAGRDSWCFVMGDLWVSVRRDHLGHRPEAYAAACDLRDSGLDFLLCPLRGDDGQLTRRVGGFPVVVFPLVTGAREVAADDPRDVELALQHLDRFHHAIPPRDLPMEEADEGFDEALLALLEQPAPQPSTGPHATAVATALAGAHSTLEWCARRLGRAALAYASASPRRTVTHGDASAQNMMITREGRMLLGDLGALAMAPPERDWFHVDRSLGTSHESDPSIRDFYRLRWLVTEILEYGSALQRPHADDEDAAQMWRELQALLADASSLWAREGATRELLT
ncbi:MAG: spectinomycin phosphotransferase [Acidimicrobiaceae bacterium]|nr:spectinomycin phosphotransferase [Acidimicrobiaceae bacterium]